MKPVDASYVKTAAARLGANLCGIAPAARRCTEGGGFYLSCHECRTVCPNCLGLVRAREE